MSTYSAEQKYSAICRLVANLGDVEKTQEETGIPRSTLFHWKNQLKSNEAYISLDYSTRSIVIIERYNRVRDKILVEMERLADAMTIGEDRYLAEYALAFSRLADRIHLIENIILKTGHYEIEIRIKDITDHDPHTRLASTDDP
jgi:hypothetical protein